MAMIANKFLRLSFSIILFTAAAAEPLSASFYNRSCPSLAAITRRALEIAVAVEPLTATGLLRLHFHDCFVEGCDASNLLDDAAGFLGEKRALPNLNSARGFELVDDIKTAVEVVCPKTVSCADILALCARDVVSVMGGPSWTVELGRRDSTKAYYNEANLNIPLSNATLDDLLSLFAARNLSEDDLVALSGAHTIGQTRCITIKDRLYDYGSSGGPDPRLSNTTRTAILQPQCSRSVLSDGLRLSLDIQTPRTFDSAYFQDLRNGNGILASDQVLYDRFRSRVNAYAASQSSFFSDFAAAMVKLGRLGPLTGSSGQIRISCRKVNK